MNQRTVNGIMGIIEDLDLENMALRAYLKSSSQPLTEKQIAALIEEAKAVPGLSQKVALRWKRLRDQMQSDRDLEEALAIFSKIVPLSKDEN